MAGSDHPVPAGTRLHARRETRLGPVVALSRDGRFSDDGVAALAVAPAVAAAGAGLAVGALVPLGALGVVAGGVAGAGGGYAAYRGGDRRARRSRRHRRQVDERVELDLRDLSSSLRWPVSSAYDDLHAGYEVLDAMAPGPARDHLAGIARTVAEGVWDIARAARAATESERVHHLAMAAGDARLAAEHQERREQLEAGIRTGQTEVRRFRRVCEESAEALRADRARRRLDGADHAAVERGEAALEGARLVLDDAGEALAAWESALRTLVDAPDAPRR